MTETVVEPEDTASGPEGVSPEDHERRWKTLAVILVGSFMALLDTTIVNVALPSIGEGLGAGSASLAWTISAYALSFGLVLVLAGRLGDTRGRKKMFIFGLGLFTLSSLACGLAQTDSQLILARIIQGVGAGFFLPQISATIQALFQGRERARALGMLGAVVGFSTALGPITGGLLLHVFGREEGWRAVFLVNIPIGIIGVIVAHRLLPETHQPSKAGRSLDPIGLILLTVGLLLIEFPLTEGQSRGWPLWTFAMFVVALPTFVAFVAWERRQEREDNVPILPMSLVRNRGFAAGCLVGITYFAGFSSIFFAISVFWQTGLGHSPLHSGATALPFALASMVSAPLSARLTDKLGTNVLFLGCVLMIAGLSGVVAVVHFVGPTVTTYQLIVPFFVAGAGNGMIIAPNQRFVLSNVPVKMAGVGGAIVQTTQRVGTAIGVSAIATVLFTSLHVAGPGDEARAFTHAFQMAALVNIGLIVVTLLAVFLVPKSGADT